MSVRPEFRWWILTLVIVGVLLGISALALDRPNVKWFDGSPCCPHCRSQVEFYSKRCPTCRERYDWTVTPEDRSPLSIYTLSPLEARHLHDRVNALGVETAVARVAQRLQITPEAASQFLDRVGSGQCGWCGGTGLDLSPPAEDQASCPVCFGEGRCISCGRMRRVRVGDEEAALALTELEDATQDLLRWLPREIQREETARLAKQFLAGHAGTIEAQRIPFWPTWGNRWEDRTSAVLTARGRLDDVLVALAGGP